MRLKIGLISFLYTSIVALTSGAAEYNISVEQRDVANSEKILFQCEDNLIVCKKILTLKRSDEDFLVTMVAMFQPGTAYFRFGRADGDLLVDGQSYIQIAVGETAKSVVNVGLSPPDNQSQRSPPSIYQQPVIRIPEAIAKLKIEVDPRR
jgi:hypothetical protein